MKVERTAMSVRVKDSDFNLRSVFDSKCDSSTKVTKSVNEAVADKSQIRFNLNGFQPKSPVNNTQDGKSAPISMQLSFLEANNHEKTINVSSVMRLTAINDDLNTRLKKANTRAVAAEAQLQTLNNTLRVERSTMQSKLQSLNSKVVASNASEAQLRGELSKVSNAVPKVSQQSLHFDTAVSAALAIDKELESARKETTDLKNVLGEEQKRYKGLEKDAAHFQSVAESLSANAEALEVSLKEASDLKNSLCGERERCRHLQETVLQLQIEAESCSDALANADELKSTIATENERFRNLEKQLVEAKRVGAREATPSLDVEEELVKAQEKVAALETRAEVSENGRQAMILELEKANEKVDAVVSDKNKVQMETEIAVNELTHKIETLNAAAAAASDSNKKAVDPQVANYYYKRPDPVKMHRKYTHIRAKLVETTKHVVHITGSGASHEEIKKFEDKRDKLYAKAVDMKSKYDTIFGAVDLDSVADSSGTESLQTHQKLSQSKERNNDEVSYIPEGEEPYVVQSKLSMSSRFQQATSPIFGKLTISADYCQNVGEFVMTCPHEIAANETVENAEETTLPTQASDAKDGMIKAVIYDLTNFLNNVKERAEARANKEKAIRKEAEAETKKEEEREGIVDPDPHLGMEIPKPEDCKLEH